MPTMKGVRVHLADLDPPLYTAAQVAKRLRVSETTVTRWRRNKVYTPSEVRRFGSVTVPLYTEADVTNMREIKKRMKPGPKPRNRTL